jgi:hypothetical protein
MLPGGNQRHRTASLALQLFQFEPVTQPWIVNLRLALPEMRLQSALDSQVVQFQIDAFDVLGKIAADIIDSNIESGDAMSRPLRFNHHTYLHQDPNARTNSRSRLLRR